MSSDIIIREMIHDDIDAALSLWRTAFNAGFSGNFDTYEVINKYLLHNPGFSSVAYTVDSNLVGALMCGHDGRRGSIYHTAVNPQYRRMGIGHRMEERSLNKLSDSGITSGFLFINIRNPGSKEFWTDIGWDIIGDIRYLYKEF